MGAIRTDPGTFSAVLLGWHDRIRGYLNATPQSGAEMLVNWASFRPAHNHEEGDATSFATPRRSGCDPLGQRRVRDRPLRQHLRALQGDRLHRARDAGHHGRRRRGPASGPDTPGTPAPARGCELLQLTQPGTSDTPAPCVTSGRLDRRGAHARSGRPAAAPGRGPMATAPSAITSVSASLQAPLSRLLQDRHVVAKANVLLSPPRESSPMNGPETCSARKAGRHAPHSPHCGQPMVPLSRACCGRRGGAGRGVSSWRVCRRRACRTSCGPRGDAGNNPCSRQGHQVVAPGSTGRRLLVGDDRWRHRQDADIEQPDCVAGGVGGP
jgi:hypothetical protein